MSLPNQDPSSAAGALYALLPRGLSSSTWEEYGLDLPAGHGVDLSAAILILTLYWIRQALTTWVAKPVGTEVLIQLAQQIEAGWISELGLGDREPDDVFDRAEEHWARYETISLAGGDAMTVANEAVAALEFDGVLAPGTRSKALALLMDVVPVESVAELVESFPLPRASYGG
jgi:hypothetical protein